MKLDQGVLPTETKADFAIGLFNWLYFFKVTILAFSNIPVVCYVAMYNLHIEKCRASTKRGREKDGQSPVLLVLKREKNDRVPYLYIVLLDFITVLAHC